MTILLIHGYYLNDRYIESSRAPVELEADQTGAELLELARNTDWPEHLRPKLGSLFLETAERKAILLDATLREQGLRDGSEVRLRLGLR